MYVLNFHILCMPLWKTASRSFPNQEQHFLPLGKPRNTSNTIRNLSDGRKKACEKEVRWWCGEGQNYLVRECAGSSIKIQKGQKKCQDRIYVLT